MTLRRVKPLRFSPAGVSDSLAEEDAFPGACANMINLMPDPGTKNLWTCRPAAINLTAFASFTSPTGVPVFKVIGNYVYGFVSTSRFAGKDEPFCYNLLTSSFVALTGVTSANCPSTQPTTGEWTPPTMDIVGIYVIATHPGYDGVTNFFGWFDSTLPNAPVYYAGNFSINGAIQIITIVNGGTAYTNGVHNNVALSYLSAGGSGTGATANITVAGGVVTSVVMANQGAFYTVGDQLTAITGLGPGTGFIANVTFVTFSPTSLTGSVGYIGGLVSLGVAGSGAGLAAGTYTNVPIGQLLQPTGGGSATSFYAGASGALATIVVAGGVVTSAVITSSGFGYIGTGSSVTVPGGTPSFLTPSTAFAGQPVLSPNAPAWIPNVQTAAMVGGIQTLLIKQGGSGLSGAGQQTLIYVASGGGSGASANITISGGAVTAVALLNPGQGYSVNDLLTYSGGGTGSAQFQCVVTAVTGGSAAKPLVGGVLQWTLTGGSGYTSGTYSQVPFSYQTPPGTGTGFQANVIVTGGVVTSVVPTYIGNAYVVGDVLTATPSQLGGGGGSGFKITLTNVTAIGGFAQFTTVPSFVRQFNGRAWFGVNPPQGTLPSLLFSDVYALNVTNADQELVFGDTTALVGAAPLGLSNLLGGIVQSLIVFKLFNGIIQITGDPLTSNLTVNQVVGGTGTASQRSITPHPQGVLFLDHDGYRMIDMEGICSDPIGTSGAGVSASMLVPQYRSRVNAACNGSVLRVSYPMANGTWVEYWFDLVRKNWSGPHTNPSTMIDFWQDEFIVASKVTPAALQLSAVQPEGATSFVENGATLTWTYQTCIVNDNGEMAESEIAEMQIRATDVSAAGLTSVTINILDPFGNVIATTTYSYAGNNLGLNERSIVFSAPVVYNRMAVQVTGTSVAGFQIGEIHVKMRILGYMQPAA